LVGYNFAVFGQIRAISIFIHVTLFLRYFYFRSGLSIDTDTAPNLQNKETQKRVRKSIKNFFGTANKFQKVMKRGVYFACLIYHEERVLVTNEEVLPIIEIGKWYPGGRVISGN